MLSGHTRFRSLWRYSPAQACARSFQQGLVSAAPKAQAQTEEASDRQTFEQDRILPDGVLRRHNPGASTSSSSGSSDGRLQPKLSPTAPQVPPATQEQLDQLADYIQGSRRVVVMTGAGCSTESNIPDYRGPKGAYSTGFKPMTHQQFMASPRTRARYWARSFAGWQDFSSIQPNAAHEAISRLQQRGWLGEIITQNVDRLHHKAGSPGVLELHGTTHRVICMSCGQVTHRQKLQDKLLELNPGAAAALKQMREGGRQRERSDSDEMDEIPVIRPDGDVELRDAGHGFLVPPCDSCGGFLKPNVVFFGDGIPKDRAAQALTTASSCDTMLVVGSSLQVYSAYRLARAATSNGAKLIIVTAGGTRADGEATMKVEALAGETLARLGAHHSLLIPKV